MSRRPIYLIYIGSIDGIEFQNVVVYLVQGIEHFRLMNKGGIAQHAYLGFGKILVAKCQGIGNDTGKMRMGGRLPITGKGQHIGLGTILLHIFQTSFERIPNLLTGRELLMRTMVAIETTLAIDAIECTELAIGRQKIDAQRNAQTTTMHRAEYRRRIDNCCHKIFLWGKDTYKISNDIQSEAKNLDNHHVDASEILRQRSE